MPLEVESDTFTSIFESFQQTSVLFFQNKALKSHRVVQREQVGSEQGNGPSNKKHRIMSMPVTAPAATVDVKEEDLVVGQVVDGIVVELAFTTEKAYEVLGQTLEFVYQLYEVPFQGLLGVLYQSRKDIFDGIQALICDLPCNTRLIAELSNLERDQLGLRHITHFVSCF